MQHGNADVSRARGKASLCYRIGYGIDTVAGSQDDRVIVCGREGSASAFLVEDAATYNARTGSATAGGQILVSANGALLMSLSGITEITVHAADSGDCLTMAGDFSGTMLGIDGLSFLGASDRVDVSGVTSGHRVNRQPDCAAIAGTDHKPARDRAPETNELLAFRAGSGAGQDEPEGVEW